MTVDSYLVASTISRTTTMSVSPGCLYLVPCMLLLLVDTAGSTFPKEYHCDNDFSEYTYNNCHSEWSEMGCYREEHSGDIGSCAGLCNTIHSLRGEGVCQQKCGRYFSTCTLAILTTTEGAIASSSDPNTGTSETSEHQLAIILGSVLGSVGAIVIIIAISAVCCCWKKKKFCFNRKEQSYEPVPPNSTAISQPTPDDQETIIDNNENNQRVSTSQSTVVMCTETNDPNSTPLPNADNTNSEQPTVDPSAPEQLDTDSVLPAHGLQEQTTNNPPPSHRSQYGADDGYGSTSNQSIGSRSHADSASSASSEGFTVGGAEEIDSEGNQSEEHSLFVEVPARQDGPDGTLQIDQRVAEVLTEVTVHA